MTKEYAMENFRYLREVHNYTQKEMAKLLNVDERQIRRYETQSTLKVDVINGYAMIFKVQPYDLIFTDLASRH